MSAVTSRYEAPDPVAASPPRFERGDGAAEIVFGRGGLVHLYQRTPCRVLFPDPEPGDLKVAALLTTSGGLAGGDRLALAIKVEAGARAVATTAAAEKIYRSLGPSAEVSLRLVVAEGGWLEFLPQETILFDRARLTRRLAAELAVGARLIAAEMLVFGRAARGERFRHGLLHEAWRVRIGGRLVWADALRLEGDVGAGLAAPFGMGAAAAVATVLYVGEDAADHLSLAREAAEAGGGGASLVNGVLIARFAGE
ncbi:MAG TPA: urease accessory protein UreD, partial [Stellaceae bacterium]|nr:urease accessory protein UreD [Stellaceae bacterium]